MKNLLIVLAFALYSNSAVAQLGVNYLRLGKKTTAELEALDRSDTDYIYTAYNTDLQFEVIDIGNGWEPRLIGGDDLGNHTATTILDAAGHDVINVDNLDFDTNVGSFNYSMIHNLNTIGFVPVNGYITAYSSSNVMGFLLNNILYLQQVGLDALGKLHVDFNSLTGPVTLKVTDNDILYNDETLFGGNMSKATYDIDDDGTVDNSEQLGGISPGQFLRSDVDDATNSGVRIWLRGAISGLEGSDAALQVNGFLRTGEIYLHEGSTPNANANILRNNAGSLTWDNQTVWHEGNDGPGSNLSADRLDNYNSSSSTAAWTIPIRDNYAALSASAFNISSDQRLKTNVQDYLPQPITVTWKRFDFNNGLTGQIGVVAQDLLVNHPEFVNTGDDGYYSVNYIGLLIAKMAEKDAQIQDLITRVELLEAN